MHEASLARAVVTSVTEELATRDIDGARVSIVHLAVGELSQVDATSLRFAYEFAVEETQLRRSRLEIVRIPARLRCTSCGRASRFSPEYYFECSECGGGCQVEAGREFEITGIDLVDPDQVERGGVCYDRAY
ncbi:hydrogenase maturation nickel metallochaperone HypA [Ferrimicrobium sp.]|uniref:hydrogenase maturation nickel metallochaperone HypA/HybF n=1 Tax=Ferrimicrobium sp. TaxID=2926050 RepID=UPI00262A9AEF|nr:hydrogenase maturation nickel metallochaperone HypA [Ferrimicrobium sp.]